MAVAGNAVYGYSANDCFIDLVSIENYPGNMVNILDPWYLSEVENRPADVIWLEDTSASLVHQHFSNCICTLLRSR